MLKSRESRDNDDRFHFCSRQLLLRGVGSETSTVRRSDDKTNRGSGDGISRTWLYLGLRSAEWRLMVHWFEGSTLGVETRVASPRYPHWNPPA